MPKYAYIAKSSPKDTLQGEIEAETKQEAINRLLELGYFPITVKPQEIYLDKPLSFGFKKIPHKDIVLFTRQLSSLIEAGVNIINSINIVSKQIPNKYLRVILEGASSKIKDGKSLSESLKSYANVFSDLYTSMILSGETSGKLDITLGRLADFLERQEEFRDSVRSALAYPVFVLSVGILTVIILLGFVIPRLVNMFADLGQVLPLPTKILISVSNYVRNYWWFILAIIFGLIFALKRIYHSPSGRIYCDRFKLKLAIIGEIALKTDISRLMRTLSLLLSGGVSIVPSLDIATSIMENQVLKSEIQRFKEEIIKGASLSYCFKNSKLFPLFITNIVTIGEETGSLEKSLLRIADDYERELDRSLKTLARMLEPLIILIVGIVVGFIVLSMLLPIFQINLIVR